MLRLFYLYLFQTNAEYTMTVKTPKYRRILARTKSSLNLMRLTLSQKDVVIVQVVAPALKLILGSAIQKLSIAVTNLNIFVVL